MEKAQCISKALKADTNSADNGNIRILIDVKKCPVFFKEFRTFFRYIEIIKYDNTADIYPSLLLAGAFPGRFAGL